MLEIRYYVGPDQYTIRGVHITFWGRGQTTVDTAAHGGDKSTFCGRHGQSGNGIGAVRNETSGTVAWELMPPLLALQRRVRITLYQIYDK